MTLNNPKPTFQGQAILWRWISPKWLRHGHSYYERGKGTAIYLCHFQWPWTNPNPVFKVTPLVGAKYLINGYRYGHSYYRPEQTNTYTWNSIILSWQTSRIDKSLPYFVARNLATLVARCLSVRLLHAGIELIELCLRWRNRKLYVIFYYLKKMVLSINLNNKKWHSQTQRGGTDASISAVTSKAPLWRASWPGRDGSGFRLRHRAFLVCSSTQKCSSK